MKRFKKLLVTGTAVFAVVASVTGAALASNRGTKAPSRPATSVAETADTDNIQEGDQTSPDNESESSGESDSSEESKSSGESDGPGGHEDPPGQDVNHEFDGEE